MVSKTYLVGILSIGMCSGLCAEIIELEQVVSETPCGRDVDKREVMVLDLEPLRREPQLAQKFVDENAGQYRLIDTKPEVIITRSRVSKDPYAAVRQAQKYAVRHGCDLVLVLKTGPYLGRQRGRSPRVKDQGYAMVVMGQRIQ